MSKTSLCIKMLELLNTGRVFKATELANLLETNVRNIIEYKKELEEAGYYISSVPGRYGGYKLETNSLFPSLKLTQVEKSSLVEAYNYCLSKKDFIHKDDYIKCMGKILSNTYIVDKDNDLMVVDHYQLAMSEEDIQIRYKFIEEAIELKQKIEINYESTRSGLKKHILDPYKLFIYNNSWFFLAWDPDVCDIHYFKLNRIKEFKMLKQKFRVWKDFKPEKYFDSTGLKNNGDYYHLEFIAKGVRAMLMKERVYGKNQVIEELEDGNVKVSLDMQNKGAIISFVLGCGTDIELLSPDWLIEEVRNKLFEMIKIY